MMNNEQYLFTLAAEEAVEVAHRAHKAIRFTAAEIQPGQELTNADRLIVEFIELNTIITLLVEQGIVEFPPDEVVDEIMSNKRARVEQFAGLSKILEQLE